MSAEEDFEARLNLLRKGGKIHQETREFIKGQLQPGMKLQTIADLIEGKVRELTKYDPENPLAAGSAFPTGLSINNCAAHWTPNPTQADRIRTLNEDDVIKIDFGVHFEGQIIDAAFTHAFNPTFDPLLEAAYEATQAATKVAGVDAILGEIGGTIQEVIQSYELTSPDQKTHRLTPVSDLCGHDILPYQIHGVQAVPNVKVPHYRERMKPNTIYAIETFPTSGTGRTKADDQNNSHLMIDYGNPYWKNISIKGKDKPLFKKIMKNYSTLAFCPRWLISDPADPTLPEFNKSIDRLVKRNVLHAYPPLYDKPGSYVSQYEQTIAVTENGTEILS